MTTQNPGTQTPRIVLQTCTLLVAHFRHLLEHGGSGFHTRLFSHMLHPEAQFVFTGRSMAAHQDVPTHPEHVVPCAVLISECKRMIQEGAPDAQIAALLARHWKLATITKEEQKCLDYTWGYKSKMPPGWRFEEGDTFARFHAAGIVLAERPSTVS
ncbi:hypothetical protein YS110_07725 [Acidovorax sp. YS12]|jgi:hypothetical protein|nr:hypothetical protein YS110_07725 [Acidovorax sp. YS12]